MQARNLAPEEAGLAREAMRRLAHATRKIDDPSDVYDVIGSLTGVLVAAEQVLHQLGGFHEGFGSGRHDDRVHRAASFREASELHRAAELVRQVSIGVDRAHQIEGQQQYPAPAHQSGPEAAHGLSL